LDATAGQVPFWLWPNLLSLDAPLIAAAWQSLFAHDAGVALSFANRAALPLAVWFIYLVDRLLDTKNRMPSHATARHAFYYANRPACWLMAALSLSGSAISLFFLPARMIENGLAVLSLVGAYLLIVHRAGGSLRRWFPKEAAVGFIFSIGSVLAPITQSARLHLLFPALLFGSLCWVNSSAIEVWEGGKIDAASAWLVRHLKIVARVICFLCLLPGISFPSDHAWLALPICALGFWVVEYLRPEVAPDLLRVLIDIPLLAPLLLIGLK